MQDRVVYTLVGKCLLLAVIFAVITGCGLGSTDSQTFKSEIPVEVDNPADRYQTTEFPAVGQLPRETSGSRTVTGAAFIAAHGVKTEEQAAIMSVEFIEEPDQSGDITGGDPDAEIVAPFAFAIYRFAHLEGDVIGLKIHMSTHNISPIWLAFANLQAEHWEYPLAPELSSVEIWDSTAEIDFSKYQSETGEMYIALILADDQEAIRVYDLQLITASEVSTFTATHNLDTGVKLNWEAAESTYGFIISRRESGSQNPWISLSEEPLAPFETYFMDDTAEPGKEYTYSISSAYGPYNEPDKWVWSDGLFVLGRRLISTVPLDNSEVENLRIDTVNWYNQLGFIGVDLETDHLLAFQSESFPPGDTWHWHDPGSGIAGQAVDWHVDTSQPYCIFPGSQENNTVMTVCFAHGHTIYSQVGEIDELGGLTWNPPVAVCIGPYEVLHCFKMSRRIGLLLWNTAKHQLEVFDSMDLTGRLWFDPKEWPWAWRSFEGESPIGAVDSEYTAIGETLCYKGSGSGKIKVYSIINGDWSDNSPDLPCAPGPQYVEMITDSIVPSSGVVYITPDRDEIRIVQRQFFGEWNIYPEILVHTADNSETITEFAEYCPAQYSGLNFIGYIQNGNVYYMTCNHWDLAEWQSLVLLDGSETCSNLNIIRIGSDEDYNYVVYATYLSEDTEGAATYNFRALDNRFIPAP